MEKIEAIIFAPEEIYHQQYWVPSHGTQRMKQARDENKLVLIHCCDCGCFNKALEEKANNLIKETFGDDPFIIFFQPRTDSYHILLVLDENGKSKAFPWWK